MSCRKNQKGGAVRMPARYYNNQNLYSGPNCPQQTGGCGCMMRKFWTDQANQEGGAVRMPARYYDNSNLFRGPNCDNCVNQAISHLYQPCECTRKNQTGGNATGAPFYMFTEGAPLSYSKPFQAGEGPVFDPLTPDPNW